MKTSNFANWQRQKFPGAISISRYPDRRSGFDGPEFTPLMPSAQLLKAYKEGLPWEDYAAAYQMQLGTLDAQKTWDWLHAIALPETGFAKPILLCYESAKTLDTQPCHRRLVADWFQQELGIVVPEWSKP